MSDREQNSGNANSDTSQNSDDTQNTNQNSDTQNDRPQEEWTVADWNAHVNRVARAREQKGVEKGKTAAAEEAARLKAKEEGQFQDLLRQTEDKLSQTEIRLRLSEARGDVQASAVAAGAGHPEAVWRYIKDDLEFDDDGKAKNIGELLSKAKQDVPGMFSGSGSQKSESRKADGGNRGKTTGSADMNQILRDAIRPGRSS